MKRKDIKLLVDWEGFDAGTVLRVDEKTAEELVEAKTAELYDPEAEKKAAEEKERERQVIVQAVKEALKGETPEAPAIKASDRVEVKERIDDDPKHGFKSLGEFAISVRAAEAGGSSIDKRLLVKAPTGLGEQIPADGGFLVPEEFSAQLMQKVHQTGVLVNKCTSIPMASNSIKIPTINEISRADGARQGGVRGYWAAEAALRTASDPSFGQVSLDLKKLTVTTYATDELLSDSAFALEGLLSTLAANEIGFMLDDAIINGTGVGQPLGILNAPALVTVPKENQQVADTIVFENVEKMWSRLYAPCRANAVWFVNQDCLPQLHTMAITVGVGGVPVYMPANGLAGQPYGTLYGRPVIEIEQCDTVGNFGDIILADLSQYLLGSKSSGITSATSIHLRFLYDETCYKWTLRVDGQPWWNHDLTPKNSANTLSPFVALAERA